MVETYARFVYRRRWWIVAVALVAVVGAGVWGSGVFSVLKDGGFDDPDSESARAVAVAEQALGRDAADVVVVYRSNDMSVDDPRFRDAVTSTLDALPAGPVDRVVTYWSTRSPLFVSTDRHATYATLTLSGDDDQAVNENYRSIADQLDAPGLTTQVGGRTPVFVTMNEQTREDIARAEAISLPVLLVLLVVIFGSLAAASLPLAIGAIGIVGALATLRALAEVSDVSVFALNIVTLTGLGLAIDYGLFMVSRFREELGHRADTAAALSRTMATAGRTVAVSGVTVAISLAGLTFFDIPFLRSMGFGGIAIVTIDMVAALTVMPAMLAILGRRVDALSFRRLLRRRPQVGDDGAGAWARIAHSVMRRPLAYALTLLAVLLVLGLPVLHLSFGAIDSRALPAGTEARVASETLSRDFVGGTTLPIQAVVRFDRPVGDAERAAVSAYLDSVRHLPGVSGADITGLRADVARISIRYDSGPTSPETRRLVEEVRALSPPAGAQVLVGGEAASVVDRLGSIGGTLPWTALFVALVTFVLLFLAFGSVVLPVKAILMNVLSLAATFGVVVWIFQDGHLADLLDFTPTGSIEPSNPILMLAILFGLSMDYEVFLLSRVREQYALTGDNADAVATGLQRTGGIITSAAVLLLVVIGAFSTSGIAFLKLIGVGMFVAIVLDATVIRILLVPATMRLLGTVNWWAPGPLRRFSPRYGLRDGDGAPDDVSGREQAPVPA